MDEVKINTSKTITLTLPADPANNAVSVSLYHEFGDLISGPTNATRASAGIYNITYGQQASGLYILKSAGKHRADFSYTVANTAYTQSIIFNVYVPYVTYEEFFAEYPELEPQNSNKFEKIEKRIKNIINAFTGQNFEPYYNQTVEIEGNGYKQLHLPLPIFNLKTVKIDVGTSEEQNLHDSTQVTLDNMEKVKYQPFNFNSSFYIKWKNSLLESTTITMLSNRFKKTSQYSILGDYGWQYVPENIKQAAILLIADAMNDDSAYRRHGIYSVDLDVVKFSMKDNFYESTGNIEVDTLLMDYTLFIMDYVV